MIDWTKYNKLNNELNNKRVELIQAPTEEEKNAIKAEMKKSITINIIETHSLIILNTLVRFGEIQTLQLEQSVECLPLA